MYGRPWTVGTVDHPAVPQMRIHDNDRIRIAGNHVLLRVVRKGIIDRILRKAVPAM